MNDEFFLKKAIDLARTGMNSGQGGPFGALIVKDGEIISATSNQVTSTNDPTAHAEVVAIREACQQLNTFQLTGCTLYTYWARPDRIVYAAFDTDAAEAGFDDRFIYDELDKPRASRSIPMTQLLRADAQAVFGEWIEKGDKSLY